MKPLLTVLFLCFLTSCITPQSAILNNRENWVYLDQDKNQITAKDFQQKWRNKKNNLVRFDYVAKDTGRVATLFEPIYSQYLVNYSVLSKKLEELTGKQFSENAIFLLEYTYVNDLCSNTSTNEWSKGNITARKNFTTPNKKAIEKQNPDVVILNFFEEGIALKNSPDSKKEYFFVDKGNFLRTTIFKNSSLCGSFALIKTSGQTLVRNGESNAKYMKDHLKPENWHLFFAEE